MFSNSGPLLKFVFGAGLLAIGAGTQLARTTTRPTALAAAAPAAAVPDPNVRHRLSSGRRVTIDANRQGQFQADVEIEGKVVPMMVDTGATAVSLSWDAAASMGIHPGPYDFNVRMRTANGIARAALVRLREVRVGGIVVRDVEAVVSPPGHATPDLLGMTFLNALGHFQISNRTLVLEQ